MLIKTKTKLILIGIVLIVFLFFFRRPIVIYSTLGSDTIKVTKTDIKRYKNQDLFLVFSDKGTYRIEDCFWVWQYRSSDLYGRLEWGKTYKIKYYGIRWGFFSYYKNIYSVMKIPEQ